MDTICAARHTHFMQNDAERPLLTGVVIRGIEVHVWDLMVLLIKVSLAAIPAMFILTFLIGGVWVLYLFLIRSS